LSARPDNLNAPLSSASQHFRYFDRSQFGIRPLKGRLVPRDGALKQPDQCSAEPSWHLARRYSPTLPMSNTEIPRDDLRCIVRNRGAD
jgi:hypothetical protein